MKISIFLAVVLLGSVTTPLASRAADDDKGAPVTFPAGLQHDQWDVLLKKFVDDHGLVAYEKWKNNATDLKALDEYLVCCNRKGFL